MSIHIFIRYIDIFQLTDLGVSIIQIHTSHLPMPWVPDCFLHFPAGFTIDRQPTAPP
jgi:hypothetical protein